MILLLRLCSSTVAFFFFCTITAKRCELYTLPFFRARLNRAIRPRYASFPCAFFLNKILRRDSGKELGPFKSLPSSLPHPNESTSHPFPPKLRDVRFWKVGALCVRFELLTRVSGALAIYQAAAAVSLRARVSTFPKEESGEPS